MNALFTPLTQNPSNDMCLCFLANDDSEGNWDVKGF